MHVACLRQGRLSTHTTNCEGEEVRMDAAVRARIRIPKVGPYRSPVLAFPNALPFILDTDASNHAIGAVLSQRDANGRQRVIAFSIRSKGTTAQRDENCWR